MSQTDARARIPSRTASRIASFPLGGIDAQGRFGFAAGNTSIREVIWGLLATRPGERIGQPRFGVGLHDYLHLPNTETTRSLIRENIATSIARYEPRIVLEELIVDASPVRPDRIDIRIHYRPLDGSPPDVIELSVGGAA
jgi:hypothetical protein